MQWYYVATLAVYVVVEAANATEAREIGRRKLISIFEREGLNESAVVIKTVRLATSDEVSDYREEMSDRALARG